MLTQEEIDEIFKQLEEEYGKEYTDFLEEKAGEVIMKEDILSILDDEYMTDGEKLDAIREYLESV